MNEERNYCNLTILLSVVALPKLRELFINEWNSLDMQKPWNEVLSLVKQCSAHDEDILPKIDTLTKELLKGQADLHKEHADLHKGQSDIKKRLETVTELLQNLPGTPKSPELQNEDHETPNHDGKQPAMKESQSAASAKDESKDRKPEATFYAFDRSHSMSSMGDAPSEALFKETRDKSGDSIDGDYVYIQTFDDEVDPPLYDGPASEIKLTLEAIKERLSPRGKTALNDAFALLLKEAIKFREANPDHEIAAVIYTDGIENSSKQYGGKEGLKKLTALVESAREDMGIHVVFMAAHIDAIKTGKSYGVPQGSCLQAGEGNFDGLQITSKVMRKVSVGKSDSVYFTPVQRNASRRQKIISSIMTGDKDIAERKPEATFYAFNRSGSMSSMGDAPSEALFKETRDKLADARDGDYVYIQTFDDIVDPPLYDGPASDIKLTFEEIRKGLEPRSRTALNDAFAILLKNAITFCDSSPGHEVAAVVYTDGAENSSVKYEGPEGLKEVSALVRKACIMGIEVIFMAANIDAFATGSSFGIPRASCLQAGQGNFIGLQFAREGIRKKNIGRSGFRFTDEQRYQSSLHLDNNVRGLICK